MLTKSDLSSIKTIVNEVVEKKLKPIRKDLRMSVDLLDRLLIRLEKRVKRVEDHLDLPQIQ